MIQVKTVNKSDGSALKYHLTRSHSKLNIDLSSYGFYMITYIKVVVKV